tara:strand:- start:4744 stop:5046 length:303 start_codon:yes stop_codon:yes gene_type:complete
MVQEYILFIKNYKMKLFIYKSLLACLLIFILFHLTIGYTVRSYEIKIQNYISKDKITFLKSKLRSEIENGLSKDRILTKEDSILINNFLKKINKELNDTK